MIVRTLLLDYQIFRHFILLRMTKSQVDSLKQDHQRALGGPLLAQPPRAGLSGPPGSPGSPGSSGGHVAAGH